MQFEVTILGSNGAIPAYDRHPSSQILNYNGNLFLIDCGEGTQFQMNKFGIKRGHLDHIFISHLHGDHFFGLVGLLTSFNLNWREHPLHIYGPPALEEIIYTQFKQSLTKLKFEIHFHPVHADKPRTILDTSQMTVETIVLKHRLPTTGFIFREKKNLRKILPEKIQEYAIPFELINDIKNGANFMDKSGRLISNQELTIAPPQPRSYAYCSDTIYVESFIGQIKGIDLLYHEATFAEEHAERANETFHSTARQAASVAKAAKVEKLIIGHFSARYSDLSHLLEQSRAVFSQTYLAEEGKTFKIESDVLIQKV